MRLHLVKKRSVGTQRTYEWVKNWGMLETMKSPAALVDMDVGRALTQGCNATYFRGGI